MTISGMFRSAVGASGIRYREEQVNAVERLAEELARGGEGGESDTAALQRLDDAANTLRIEVAPRSYRNGFTANYRQLFPYVDKRYYRTDVLDAALDEFMVIWVNGEKFELGAETRLRAQILRDAWGSLGRHLRSQGWDQVAPRPQRSMLELTTVRSVLAFVDQAWSRFEEIYIGDLIHIEQNARGLLLQAVESEQRLAHLEGFHSDISQEAIWSVQEYHEEMRSFFAVIGRINAVANTSRKGRDDMNYSVLESACVALRSYDAWVAARVLATDMVESFDALRAYLRFVKNCPERVDPQLSRNAGLVERLVDLEESWEVCDRYVNHAPMLNTVCNLVYALQAAQRLIPRLVRMCEDCDAELFMVLPRLLWLCALTSSARHTELIRSLLPHCFDNGPCNARTDASRLPGAAARLADLLCLFQRAEQLHANAAPAISVGSDERSSDDEDGPATTAAAAFWEALVRKAVGEEEAASEGMAARFDEPGRKAIEDLMHELERWSIELQRHCPEEWNQCSSVILRCLGGQAQKKQVAIRV